MLLDECFCSYHSLRQQNNLSEKLHQLNVNVQCQHQDLFHHEQKENENLKNGGKKRNFSSTSEDDRSAMRYSSSLFENNIEHKTKVQNSFFNSDNYFKS